MVKLKSDKKDIAGTIIWAFVVIFLIGTCALLAGCTDIGSQSITNGSHAQITAIDASYATLPKECKTDAVNAQYKSLKENAKVQEGVCLQAVDSEQRNTESWMLKFWLAIAGFVGLGYLYLRKILR